MEETIDQFVHQIRSRMDELEELRKIQAYRFDMYSKLLDDFDRFLTTHGEEYVKLFKHSIYINNKLNIIFGEMRAFVTRHRVTPQEISGGFSHLFTYPHLVLDLSDICSELFNPYAILVMTGQVHERDSVLVKTSTLEDLMYVKLRL